MENVKKFRRIGVLTSGGDAPGMNAAYRAVVRAGLDNGIEVVALYGGYRGLVESDFKVISRRCEVSNIINLAGTCIYTDRCTDFATEPGMQKALVTLKENNIEGIVAIGGDGTFRGATDLASRGIPTIGIPGTIDNDITATDYTIGFGSAVDITMKMIDSLRATVESHARCCVVEVMGRHAGHIALRTAVACGAFAVAVPEFEFDEEKVIKDMIEARAAGKRGFVIIVSEGCVGYGEKLTKTIEEKTGITTRFICPAHIQRGGDPTADDRIIASEMGSRAIDELIRGNSDIVITLRKNQLGTMNIKDALNVDRMFKGKMTPEEKAALTPDQNAWMQARCDEVLSDMKRLYDLVYEIR